MSWRASSVRVLPKFRLVMRCSRLGSLCRGKRRYLFLLINDSSDEQHTFIFRCLSSAAAAVVALSSREGSCSKLRGDGSVFIYCGRRTLHSAIASSHIMPTLRSKTVTSPSSGTPSIAPASLFNATYPSPASAPLPTLNAGAASSLDPVTPAGDREQYLPPISPRPQQQKGSSRRRKDPEKKLNFEQHSGVEESMVRRSRRVRGGECAEAISGVQAEAVLIASETTDNMAVVDRGKRKVVDRVSDSDEEENKTIDSSDSGEEIGKNGQGLRDAGRETCVVSTRNGEGSGNGKRGRSARDGSSSRCVNMNAQTDAAGDVSLSLDSPVQASGHRGGFSVFNSRGLPRGNQREVTRAKFLEIARRRAAHFAHFSGEVEESTTVPVADASSVRSVDEQRSRAFELLAAVSAGSSSSDGGEAGDWPGPFVVARQLVEGRAAAIAAREKSTREEERVKPCVEWLPSREPHFRKRRVAKSLHDMCVEILCANIEHVQSLGGVTDAAKKRVSTLLCAQRNMTPKALRLYLLSEPGEIVVPDCTFVTEESLTEAVASCATERLEVLELGMCGRGLSDQLCATTLARFACSLPILHTLTLKGAYRLTDNGLKALLLAAPNLVTLNLVQCNMLSAAGLDSVADSVGPTLKGLSLECCCQLDALKVLPSLLKMSSLRSLSLSGVAGVSDGIVSELAVVLGPGLQELSIADCMALTDSAIVAISLCCIHLQLLDLGHIPMLTDVAVGRLADGCRTLKTLRLNRGKFSDTALAALITTSGHFLNELSLNSVRQAGDYTVSALAKHSSGTLEKLDLSFCRTVSDEALGFLADSCSGLREVRLFGCTQDDADWSKVALETFFAEIMGMVCPSFVLFPQTIICATMAFFPSTAIPGKALNPPIILPVTNRFLEGHSNPALDVMGFHNSHSNCIGVTQKPTSKLVHRAGSGFCPSQACL